MQGQFWLMACVGLKAGPGKKADTCEVGNLVESDFIKNLNLTGLWGEVLVQCVGKLKTSKINLLSLEIVVDDAGVSLQANVILAKEETGNKVSDDQKTIGEVVDLSESHNQTKLGDLLRLCRYMELFAQREIGRGFSHLICVRVSKFDANDISVEKF